MPFRLGFPERKFLVKFFDPALMDEMPVECCNLWYLWFDKSPEDILQRAQTFANLNEIDLVCISEILWEKKND